MTGDTSKAREVIRHCQALGVEFLLTNAARDVSIEGPDEVLTPAFLASMAKHKAELLAALVRIEEDKVAAALARRYPLVRRPCYACHALDFWASENAGAGWICRWCHPPAAPELVTATCRKLASGEARVEVLAPVASDKRGAA